MRLIDVFRIAIRMLQTNLLRSVLTILGIGVAISLIVILIGLGYGLQEITIGSIIHSKSLFSLDVSQSADHPLPVNLATIEEIKKLKGVKEVSPVVATSGELSIRGQLAAVVVSAGTQNYLEMEGITITQGKGYTDNSREIVLSPQVAELLDLQPGDVLNLKAKLNYNDPNNENRSQTVDNLTIVGISDLIDTPTVNIPFSLLSPTEATNLNTIKVSAKDRESIIVLRDIIIEKGYQVETLLETLDQARTIFRWVTIGLTGFGLIALIVASIGMFNTLTIALLERTREIGIMKAIGVTDSAVMRLFLAEAGIIGLFGGLSGIGIGLLLDYAASTFMNQLVARYGGNPFHLFQYPTGFLLGMVIFPIVLALCTGFYPAIRAARLNPLRALKYE